MGPIGWLIVQMAIGYQILVVLWVLRAWRNLKDAWIVKMWKRIKKVKPVVV
jgi:hypothetical protein